MVDCALRLATGIDRSEIGTPDTLKMLRMTAMIQAKKKAQGIEPPALSSSVVRANYM